MTLSEVVGLITAIAALGAAGASLLNLHRVQEVHLAINSRMDELLRVSSLAARAEGLEEGRVGKNTELKPGQKG